MSNARIQFSLASEDVWNAYDPQLKEGEIVTVLKANKKVKLVQGKVGGSTYSESTVIWDQDIAETIMSRSEAAGSTATAQAAAASASASKAAASQSAAATSQANAKASENAAKTSETNAKSSETAAKNSATSAASSASIASTQAGKAADSATTAAGSATQAGTFATTATSQATAADKSATAADKSATAADKSATAAAASSVTASDKASEAATSAKNAAVSARLAEDYKGDTKTYMDNAKNYSENVNVFVPSVSSDGILSWTNKAGLPNPPSVNIKGKDGKDGGITVDAELNDTSTNPIQNRVVKVAIDNVTASIPTKVSALENDAGYLNMGTLPSFPSTDSANTWKQRQIFYEAALKEAILAKASIVKESYQTEYITSDGTNPTTTPNRSTMYLTIASEAGVVVPSQQILDMTTIVAECLGNNKNSTVFTAYITSDADYTLTITNAGTIKYIGSASDVAITSAGLLLNIMMLKDASGNVTSIVQASKLEGGA